MARPARTIPCSSTHRDADGHAVCHTHEHRYPFTHSHLFAHRHADADLDTISNVDPHRDAGATLIVLARDQEKVNWVALEQGYASGLH